MDLALLSLQGCWIRDPYVGFSPALFTSSVVPPKVFVLRVDPLHRSLALAAAVLVSELRDLIWGGRERSGLGLGDSSVKGTFCRKDSLVERSGWVTLNVAREATPRPVEKYTCVSERSSGPKLLHW